jgi:hypothetical protein
MRGDQRCEFAAAVQKGMFLRGGRRIGPHGPTHQFIFLA